MHANLKRFLARACVLAAFLALAGCAVGNRYDYAGSISALPVTGTGSLGLNVVDARPYVLSGDKTPDFIGLQRGGFGNPFDVRTASGRPLADEMRDAIAKALQKQGYTVVGMTDAAPRRMELKVLEWKSDAMMHFSINYDLTLTVYDGQGALLAASTTKGESVQNAGFESANAGNAARVFEMQFTTLLRDESVRKALMPAAQ